MFNKDNDTELLPSTSSTSKPKPQRQLFGEMIMNLDNSRGQLLY